MKREKSRRDVRCRIVFARFISVIVTVDDSLAELGLSLRGSIWRSSTDRAGILQWA